MSQYYEIDGEDDSLLTFSDGTGILLSNPELEFNLGSPDCLYADMAGLLLAFNKQNHQIKILDLKRAEIVNTIEIKRRGEVTALGLNEETQQIFVGLKTGKICMFD